MFDIEATKVIHKTSREIKVIESEADVIANLRALSERKKDIEERQKQIDEIKAKKPEPISAPITDDVRDEALKEVAKIVPKEEPKVEVKPKVKPVQNKPLADKVVDKDEPTLPVANKSDNTPTVSVSDYMTHRATAPMEQYSEDARIDTLQEERKENPLSKYERKSSIVAPEDIGKPNIKDERRRITRERLQKLYGKDSVSKSGNFTGETGGSIQKSSTAPVSAPVKDEPLKIVNSSDENKVKTKEDFEKELKERINKMQNNVQKVEELKEHTQSADGDINTIKTDDVAEEIYSRNKDENKEEEIARILNQRKVELKKYEPMRKANEKKASFAKPRKQMSGAKKWLLAIGVALLFCVFCGLRANGYCYDTYGDCTPTYNAFTGQYETIEISGISCLFSSFTVDSVSFFPPVFNGKVFGTAFGTTFGICGVAILLIWSSADTRKRNRDGKEHGDSKIMTPYAIKRYQKMFMDCTNLK